MDLFKRAVDLLANLIYELFRLLVWILDQTLLTWKGFENPFVKLGSLIVTVMLLVILYQQYMIKRYRRIFHNLDVVCPFCGKVAVPIHGTVNRYRCVDGHQFNGSLHRH